MKIATCVLSLLAFCLIDRSGLEIACWLPQSPNLNFELSSTQFEINGVNIVKKNTNIIRLIHRQAGNIIFMQIRNFYENVIFYVPPQL